LVLVLKKRGFEMALCGFLSASQICEQKS